MGLLKKFFCIIILLSMLAAFFPLSSRAASSDIDVDFTHKPITFVDFENFLRKRQDTALLIIKKYNSSLFNTIKDRVINYNDFFYIAISKSSIEDIRAFVFRVYFYNFDVFTSSRVYSYGDYLDTDPLYSNYTDTSTGIDENIEIGGYQTIRVYPSYNTRYNYTVNLANHSQDATTSTTISNVFSMQGACYGYISDYAMKLFDNSTTDYNPKLNTINSNLSSLITNTSTIISKLDTIKGAIDNGSSTITNTIVSTHNNDNNNDNKNTNEIINAINNNTNAISDIQVTNDNSDLINAINNGFSGLNSNNNNNTNEIVSTINNVSEDLQNVINSSTNNINNNNNNNTNSIVNNNNNNTNEITSTINSASEEIIDGGNNNTNTIVSNSNSNTNDIVEAIEGVTISGGSGGITNSEFSQGVTAINDNNNANTNKILASTVTEEDSDIFDKVTPEEMQDPLPDLASNLTNFSSALQTGINSNNDSYNHKIFTLPIHNKNYTITLYYDILRQKLFKVNQTDTINYTFYTLWQALWWFLVGMFIFRKCKRVYNELVAGEWDEIITKTDIHDDIIDGSVK